MEITVLFTNRHMSSLKSVFVITLPYGASGSINDWNWHCVFINKMFMLKISFDINMDLKIV